MTAPLPRVPGVRSLTKAGRRTAEAVTETRVGAERRRAMKDAMKEKQTRIGRPERKLRRQTAEARVETRTA